MLIHEKFNFCLHRDLKMDYDPELVGWLSATDSLETLYNWFPEKDILELQKHDYFIHVFETDNHKFYERFQHQIIHQASSKLIKKIVL